MRPILPIALCGLALFGCAKSKADDHPSVPPSATAPAKPTAAPPPAAPAVAAPVASTKKAEAPTVELALQTVGNTMAFDKTKLTVPTGATVHVTLKNVSTMTTMAHNWVLVRPGTEAAVAAANVDKADAGFITPGPDVLAFTPLAQAGQTVEVTFTAPPPGEYPYICSFPGHYVVMKGVLTVTQ